MTAGPDDQDAADGLARGYLRVSHADREQVIDALKAAFVQGRLTKAELDARAGQAFASRTSADLAAITADLPAGLIRVQSPCQPAPAQAPPPVNKPLLWTAIAMILTAIASIVAWFPAQNLLLLTYGVLAILIAAPIAGTLLIDSWRDNHPGGQLPPRPVRGGQAIEDEQGSTPGDDLIPCQTHMGTRARGSHGPSATQRNWLSVSDRRASAGLCP